MSYFIGIDSSTTATKALVMDADGGIVGIGRSEYAFDTPNPLWAEQDAQLWWTASVDAITSVLESTRIHPSEVIGVGLTGQMHGLVMLDANGQVLRPSILWNDQRTQAECDEIRQIVGRDRLISVTGNDALTGFTAPKIRWVKNHEPEVFERTEHVLLPKDYVRYRLTGQYAMDRAGGSGTMLFDLNRRDWSHELIDALEFPQRWFPETYEGTDVTGLISAEAARITGLTAGTPVYGGGGDQAANAVGVGAVASGVVAMSIGTSGVVFAPTPSPVVEPDGRLHAFCHSVPATWHLMGVMLSAAGSLQWFRDRVAPARTFAELSGLADGVAAGSQGLVFLPYLSGERTPHPDPLARAAFVGLTVRHGEEHMTRSVMEGVAFGLKDISDLIAASTEFGEVRASGGGALSPTWVQIISDVLKVPVQVVGTAEAAAHGAALLAATGAGGFADVVEATQTAVRIEQRVEPSDDTETYEDAYGIYRDLYPALTSSFHRSARLEGP